MPKPADRILSRYAADAVKLMGASIRVARIEQELKMDEVAERAGISRGLLRRIEQGDPGASIGAVLEVAAVLGISLFEAESSRLTSQWSHKVEKLTLLPSRVHTKQSSDVDDDF